MFKSGDRVICVKRHDKRIRWVTVGNLYIVVNNMIGLDYFSTVNDNEIVGHYSNDDFIVLTEYRKRKLEKLKLCSK